MFDRAKPVIRYVQRRLYVVPAPPVLRSLGELGFRVLRNFSRNDGPHMAAGVAYYGIFSLFPLVLGIIAISGFFVSASSVQEQVLDFLDKQLPGAGDKEIIGSNIDALVDGRGALGIAAIVALFWSGRAVFGGIHRVLNRAWKVSDRPHFLLYQLGQVGAAAGIAMLFLSAVVVGPAGRAAASRTDDLFGVAFPWEPLFTLLPLTISTVIFLFIYRFVPDTRVRWRDAIPAAIFASAMLEISKIAFAYYLGNLSSLDLIYGSVTTVVVLMLFLYVVSFFLVLGAEISSEYNVSSRAGLIRFRGHWRPVRGGLAPVGHFKAMPSVRPQGLDLRPPRQAHVQLDGLVHPEGLDLPVAPR
jgi:membrane protein